MLGLCLGGCTLPGKDVIDWDKERIEVRTYLVEQINELLGFLNSAELCLAIAFIVGNGETS